MRRNILVLLFAYSFALFAQADSDKQQLQQRIQPIGTVRIEEKTEITSTTDLSTKAAVNISDKKRTGQSIYEQFCIVCHRDGLAGAPKIADQQDWKPRLVGRTLNDLLASVNKGLNAMPVKGTCSECSDDDLKAAIHYMLPKS